MHSVCIWQADDEQSLVGSLMRWILLRFKAEPVEALAWYLIATRLGASGLGGEYVAEARSATSESQQCIAEQKARDFLAEKERRCGPA